MIVKKPIVKAFLVFAGLSSLLPLYVLVSNLPENRPIISIKEDKHYKMADWYFKREAIFIFTSEQEFDKSQSIGRSLSVNSPKISQIIGKNNRKLFIVYGEDERLNVETAMELKRMGAINVDVLTLDNSTIYNLLTSDNEN